MTSRDPELERLTSMLGHCLGRIDAQAHRLLRLDDEPEEFDAAELLEDEAATLQELVGSLLAASAPAEETHVNRAVARVADGLLQELSVPILLRQNLAPDLPPVPCAPPLVTVAVQRALVLALSRLGPGGEVTITTRQEDGSVLVEIETHGASRGGPIQERVETLRDFVDGLGGRCRIDRDQRNNLLFVLELPQVLAAEDRESA